MTRVVVGSDHGGFQLGQLVAVHLRQQGVECVLVGTEDETSVDYPVYAAKVAAELQSGQADMGILLCGTGIGMSIAANKYNGIRAALCSSVHLAEMARAHNNANVLCLGGRTTDPNTAVRIVDAFLQGPFEGDRHERRLALIEQVEGSASGTNGQATPTGNK